MSKSFLKYSLVIASIFVIFQIYLTASHYQTIEIDKQDLLKENKIQKILNDLKHNKKEYKAFAAVIDDTRSWSFGYTSNHRTQESANSKALKICEKQKKNQNITKNCRLYNSLINLKN